MRLLAYNVPLELIKTLQKKQLYLCDIAQDREDALYHAQVRFYNAVVIYEDELCHCKEFLKIIDSTQCAFVVLTNNTDKEFEMSVLKNGGIAVIIAPFSQELILAKLQSIHPKNFIKRFKFKNHFTVDTKQKLVFDSEQNELNIKGKSFEILSYFFKNKEFRVISKDELVGVLWDEPELVSNNIIEVNINLIRNEIRKRFNVDFLCTIRNRGYKIQYKALK